MKTITPEFKDAVLTFFCERCNPEQLSEIDENNIKLIQDEFKFDFNNLNAMLNYFQRLGFISDLNCRHVYISFVLRIEAIDFIQTGGFTIKENVLLKNAELIMLEIEVLKKQLKTDQLETANKISSIAGVIVSALSAFSSSK